MIVLQILKIYAEKMHYYFMRSVARYFMTAFAMALYTIYLKEVVYANPSTRSATPILCILGFACAILRANELIQDGLVFGDHPVALALRGVSGG